MNIWSRIKQLKMGQLFKLSFLFMKNPLLIISAFIATNLTIKICDSRFGQAHHKSTTANAFRHAFWNFNLCQKSIKVLKNDQKSAIWVEKLTKMYENVTNNDILDEAMDLHNNEIGRMLFLTKNELKSDEMIDFLLEMVKKAQKVTHIDEIKNCKKQLVYIL